MHGQVGFSTWQGEGFTYYLLYPDRLWVPLSLMSSRSLFKGKLATGWSCLLLVYSTSQAKNMWSFVGFEVLTVVVMKSSVFWYITPCGPLKVNRHFGGTRHHHLKGQRKSSIRKQDEVGSRQSSARRHYTSEAITLHGKLYSHFSIIFLIWCLTRQRRRTFNS
jgi:hypothetical protein